MKSFLYEGDNGENIIVGDVPADLEDIVAEKRAELIEALAEVDEEIEECYLMEEEPTEEQFHEAIRKATHDLKFVPVFLGSACVSWLGSSMPTMLCCACVCLCACVTALSVVVCCGV